MPVEQQALTRGSRALIAASAGVLAAVVLLFLAVQWAGRAGENVRLGDDTFTGLRAARMSSEIDDRGPILLSDVSGEGQRRPIFLNHIGDDPSRGWYAFNARPPGKPADCFVVWRAEQSEFTDCDGVAYPADGKGLEQFPVAYEDGQLDIDLNVEDVTTTTGGPTTTD